jgi:hypothetical protein
MGAITFFFAAIGAVAVHIIALELCTHAPSLARRLVAIATARLPPVLRARYEEEWLAHLCECPGPLAKLLHGIECVVCARALGKLADVRASGAVQFDVFGQIFWLDEPTALFALETLQRVLAGAPTPEGGDLLLSLSRQVEALRQRVKAHEAMNFAQPNKEILARVSSALLKGLNAVEKGGPSSDQ